MRLGADRLGIANLDEPQVFCSHSQLCGLALYPVFSRGGSGLTSDTRKGLSDTLI